MRDSTRLLLVVACAPAAIALRLTVGAAVRLVTLIQKVTSNG